MNRINILNALDILTRPGRDLLVHADLLHAEINRLLLDLGLDTVSRDELHHLLHDDLGYHDVLDNSGRVVWRGLGLSCIDTWLRSGRDHAGPSTVGYGRPSPCSRFE